MIACSTAGRSSSCKTAESFDAMPFLEDIYLYDLNVPDSTPLAFRSARGGEAQPTLLSLLGVAPRAWAEIAQRLYDGSVYLAANGGAVLLPVQGSVGRYALVVKTTLPVSALAYLYACAVQGEAYADEEICNTAPRVDAREREAAESARQTVAALRMLQAACERAVTAGDAEECIDTAAELMGVSLMPPEFAELPPMQAQGMLPDMQPSGQVLLVSILTLLSAMRNHAHARSGWLYATPCEQGYVLQAVLRCAKDTNLDALAHLRVTLEDHGVSSGALTSELPVKPPRQYAYMSRKITDPRRPLCARCGCLDARCASCLAVRWAVLPFVCDVALLGIKALPHFEE